MATPGWGSSDGDLAAPPTPPKATDRPGAALSSLAPADAGVAAGAGLGSPTSDGVGAAAAGMFSASLLAALTATGDSTSVSKPSARGRPVATPPACGSFHLKPSG